MNDEPLLSPRRIWKSLRLWCWLGGTIPSGCLLSIPIVHMRALRQGSTSMGVDRVTPSLEEQVSLLRMEVKGLKGREQELASLEATVRTVASQTTHAIMRVDEQIARFRREVEEYEAL